MITWLLVVLHLYAMPPLGQVMFEPTTGLERGSIYTPGHGGQDQYELL